MAYQRGNEGTDAVENGGPTESMEDDALGAHRGEAETRRDDPQEQARPKQPTYKVDGRDAIFAKFRKQRDADPDPMPALTEGVPEAFGRHPDAEDDPAPVEDSKETPPASDPEAAAEIVRLRVNHSDMIVTRDQAVEMSGIPPEEAKHLSLTTIVRYAQINEANRRRTTRAGGEANETEQRQAPSDQLEASNPPADSNQPRQESNSKFKREAIERAMVFGDPEAIPEAEESIGDIAEERFRKLEAERAMKSARERVASDLRAFETENADLLQNKTVENFMVAQTVPAVLDEMVRTGHVRPEALDQLRVNPALVSLTYTQLAAAGVQMKPMRELLDSTLKQVRGLIQPPQPKVEADPARIPLAAAARVAAKEGLVQPPTRSGETVRQAQPQGFSSRTSAISKMRQGRGQSPIV